MILKDLPTSEKPRERLLKYGALYLSNEDLISIILRTGTKNQNVKVLSNHVLTKIRSISDLNNISIAELTSIKGLGKVKAITLLAAIELGKRVFTKEIEGGILLNNTDLVHQYFSHLIGSKNQEELLIILLDNKKRLINYEIMYKGTSNSAIASPKEIYYYAIKENAAALIIMHNHPSGVILPSEEDYQFTKNLIETGNITGIPVLDHLITNGKEYYSFFKEMANHEV
ncbi:MAG: DNA repair protein RadC [Bacilli bacterium]|nr:DNA repair protein RadC [Bacilli bacterium]MDD4795628.1 DNA repair protein RadC [Bacilli bacterium]